MRAPFRHSPGYPAWFWFEDFGPLPEPVIAGDLTVDVCDDDTDGLVDASGTPLRPRMPFGFCRPERAS